MKTNLEVLKALIEANKEGTKIIEVSVEEVWMDYGAGIAHTTIVIYYHDEIMRRVSSYQALNPYETEKFKEGTMTVEEMISCAKKVLSSSLIRG